MYEYLDVEYEPHCGHLETCPLIWTPFVLAFDISPKISELRNRPALMYNHTEVKFVSLLQDW